MHFFRVVYICKNNIFASSFNGLIRQWHGCYTINCSHLWPNNPDQSTVTCLYDIKIRVIFFYLFGVMRSIILAILLIMKLNVRSCSFYIIWQRFSWENTFSSGLYDERYTLRGSVPALNFVVSWCTLRWQTALPWSRAHSLIWSLSVIYPSL